MGKNLSMRDILQEMYESQKTFNGRTTQKTEMARTRRHVNDTFKN